MVYFIISLFSSKNLVEYAANYNVLCSLTT